MTKPKEKPRRSTRASGILVMRGGAIGDFILTLPALAAIRQKWPDSHLDLAAAPSLGQLALTSGLVDKVVSLDSADFARLFAPDPQLPVDLMARIQGYELIVSCLHDPDGILKRNLMAAGARRLVSASPLVTTQHAIDTLLKPLEELGIPFHPGECSRLFLSGQRVDNGRKRMAEFGDKVIMIHPGSGSPKKNWPAENFVVLAHRLEAETEFTPVLTLGEADQAIADELSSDGNTLPVLPACSLVDLAQFLSACAAYVGNDSGITHLAAAVGIPVVALFGPTDPRLWAPRGPNTKLICAPEPTLASLAAIPVDDVLSAVKKAAR